MKTLKKVLITFATILIVASCGEDELLTNNLADMSYKKAADNQQNIFWVTPTGIDDTQNLIDAFADAQLAGPGSVIQLKEGNYYINLMEVRDFNGTLKGAGRGKTIITTVENLNFDDVISQNLYPCLIKFLGGDVHVKGMTFMTKPESTDWFEGLIGFFGWSEVYVPAGKYINVVADHIEIIGQKSNVGYGLMTGSDSRGLPGGVPWSKIDISVTNSHFANCAWYGACIMMIEEGNVEVGRSNNGNTYVSNDEWSYGNLGIWHFVNTKISITRNHFQGHLGRSGGLDVFSAPYPSFFAHSDQVFPSVANIEHNTFEVSNFLSAIIINDNRRVFDPEDEPMKVQLKNNHIRTTNNTSAMRCLNLNGSVFRNNKFTGTANNGLYLDGQNSITTENGLMLGNNFSNATYKQATVILQPATRSWTVVGGNLGESILDYGIDNVITGFNNNNLDVPLGKIISDLITETNMTVHDLKK